MCGDMALDQLTDDEALALLGTTDADTGIAYPQLLQSRWAEAIARGMHRTLEVALTDLRVLAVSGNADAVAVLPGAVQVGNTLLEYAGADPAVDNLTDNDATFIWAYNDGGSLAIDSAVDATGWPSVAHVKLARVTMASGVITSIDDLRGANALRLALAGTVADLDQTISGTYSQSEVQAISDKVDALLAALRTNGTLTS